jgi:hypothetical protein
VFAYNRAHYLNQTLHSLLGLPGLDRYTVYVSQVGGYPGGGGGGGSRAGALGCRTCPTAPVPGCWRRWAAWSPAASEGGLGAGLAGDSEHGGSWRKGRHPRREDHPPWCRRLVIALNSRCAPHLDRSRAGWERVERGGSGGRPGSRLPPHGARL